MYPEYVKQKQKQKLLQLSNKMDDPSKNGQKIYRYLLVKMYKW